MCLLSKEKNIHRRILFCYAKKRKLDKVIILCVCSDECLQKLHVRPSCIKLRKLAVRTKMTHAKRLIIKEN